MDYIGISVRNYAAKLIKIVRAHFHRSDREIPFLWGSRRADKISCLIKRKKQQRFLCTKLLLSKLLQTEKLAKRKFKIFFNNLKNKI